MEKRVFQSIGEEISLLGYGCMRLPLLENGKIDYTAAQKLIDRSMEAGINYYDTAYLYHQGESETFVGSAFKKYPRSEYFLATKMPTWTMIRSQEQVREIFEEQLRKCGVDYFDFYLAHGLNAENFKHFEKIGIYEILKEKKQEGKIHHLGFSFHDNPAILEEILNTHKWDFVQIQLNYIDWEALSSKKQYEILSTRNIPVTIMEPVRGGALATLNEKAIDIFQKADPKASAASWAIRFAASLPGVMCVLSGMSTMEQLEDNIKTMDDFHAISVEEYTVIKEAAMAFRASGTIPCTGCRYCMDCPAGVDIPGVFSIYNHYRSRGKLVDFKNSYRSLFESQQAHNCIGCRRCTYHCPQKIDIPGYMHEIAEFAEKNSIR